MVNGILCWPLLIALSGARLQRGKLIPSLSITDAGACVRSMRSATKNARSYIVKDREIDQT